MPRRALLLIALVVLALHWLVLGGMPLGGTDEDTAQRAAFHTRMIVPPPPEPATAEPAATPPTTPATPAPQPTPPKLKPKPRPKPAPQPPAAPPTAPEPPADAGAASPDSSATESSDTLGPDTSSTGDAPAAIPSAPDVPASAASAPAPQASAPAERSPEDELSAGVDITPPGAAGARSDASTEPPPIQLPASTTLKYAVEGEVKKMRYNVNGELSWKNEGGAYEARQEVSAFLLGTRSQTSTGRITPQGLVPTRFGDKGKREVAAHLDFDSKIVTFSANTTRTPIGQGTQDRVSVLIQIGAMIAAAPDRYPQGTQIALTTVGPRNADRWIFTVGETRTLDLPAGPTPAIRLQKQPRHERDLQADLWLGIEQHYLPVRLRITQSNGDYAELSLK